MAVTVEPDGGAVWFCHRCGSKGVTGRGHVTGRGSPDKPTVPSADTATKTERARRTINASRLAKGRLPEAFVNRRGIDLPDNTPLLFNPDVWHWPSKQSLPAMVSPIVRIDAPDNSAPMGAHLTFLRRDGSDKAKVVPARLYSGPKAGGVVKLTPDEEITTGLAIGEGIETCLAARMAGLPTWACLDSGNMAAFPVLSGVECITLLADHDEAGIKAARECAARWQAAGKEARIAIPSRPGFDWNDEIRGGADG
jgi:hypothetical protein